MGGCNSRALAGNAGFVIWPNFHVTSLQTAAEKHRKVATSLNRVQGSYMEVTEKFLRFGPVFYLLKKYFLWINTSLQGYRLFLKKS